MYLALRERMSRVIIVSIIALTGLLFAANAQAAATINGTMYLPDGTVIAEPDCVISIAEATGLGYSTTTNTSSNGTFTFSVPDDGQYNVQMVEDECFDPSYSGFSTSQWIVDNTVTELPLFGYFNTQLATIRGRILSPSGAPLGDKQFNLISRDYAGGSFSVVETDSTGRFNASVVPGSYDIVFTESFDCADNDNPISYPDTCLNWLKRDVTYAAGTLTDLGDLQFQVGDSAAVLLNFMEEVSPGVFNTITTDSFILNGYQEDASGDLQLGYFRTEDGGGSSVLAAADNTLDWVFDVVAKDGKKVYHGSMLVAASDLGSTVTWDSLLDITDVSYPIVDFVLTEKFDLDDPNLSSLDQVFNSGIDTTLTMSNGVEIFVPESAFSGASDVRMIVEPAFDIADSYFPVDGLSYNMTIYNESTNQTIDSFSRPLTITMPYSETELLAGGIDESDIQPWYYDETSNTWKKIPGPLYEQDTTANTLTFSVNHFSQYAVAYDKLTDMTNKVTANNDVAVSRKPGKLKKVKVQKKYRRYLKIKKSGLLRGRLGISMKRPRMNITGYEVRFSTKKGKKKAIGVYKKNRVAKFNKRLIKTSKVTSRDRITWTTDFPLDKTFYVRVRPYNGYKIGKWSKPRKVRINRADTGL